MERTLLIDGKTYTLKPLTRKMQNDVINWCRNKAIKELIKNAKESDMPKDLINTQLTMLQMNGNYLTTSDPESTPYLLHLRSGADLDECLNIPDSELTEEVENIIFENEDESQEKKSE